MYYTYFKCVAAGSESQMIVTNFDNDVITILGSITSFEQQFFLISTRAKNEYTASTEQNLNLNVGLLIK